MPTTRTHDTTVAYTAAGAGPALMLLHGTGADKTSNWQPVIERLKQRLTVIAPDLSGSGATVDHGGPITLDDLVAQVLAVAEAERLDAFHLAGYSMGAVAAAAVAAVRPDLVRSLVLIGGWAESGPRERLAFDLWERLYATDPELMVRHVLLAGMSPASFAQATDEGLEQIVRSFVQMVPPGFARQATFDGRVDIRPLLGRIKAPTQIVGLTHDRMLPIAHSHALAQAIDGAEFIELEAGHLIPWEAPDLLAATIDTYVSQQAAREAATTAAGAW